MDSEISTKDKREVFMRSVYDWASLSKDVRTHIGAVLVKNEIPISAGYNNFPKKVLDLKSRYEDRNIKLNFIIHAELNSILNAAVLGHSTKGATLFSQGIPCKECMKAIINAEISTIVCHKEWPNLVYSSKWVESFKISEIMMREANIKLEWFSGKLGVKGFLDGKTIMV